MSPTRVGDDPLEGISQLLQHPEEQEAVEHKDVSQGFHWLCSQALRRHLNTQIYPRHSRCHLHFFHEQRGICNDQVLLLGS